MEAPKLSGGGATQIDDLPSCLIIDHVCQTPQCTVTDLPLKPEIRIEKEPQMLQVRGSNGRGNFIDEIYVCNPILGEYITIPTVNRGSIARTKSVLGFSSKSNHFKVLQIYPVGQIPDAAYKAEIYTIGNGTRLWREIGIAPSCTILNFLDGSSFLNGSIHWADEGTHRIVYFDFESEQFGLLPSPPAWLRDGRWSDFSLVRVGVLDGCLCIYAFSGCALMEKWVMKEYGVEESWMDIFSTHNNNIELERWAGRTTYCPSYISLQDVAKNEHLTVLSKTRTNDQDSPEGISNIIFHL